jgi:preprotein translocase subunit SecA
MQNLFSFESNIWKKYNVIINGINQIESELKTLSDNELKSKSKNLQKFLTKTNQVFTTNNIIESFAFVREASSRTLGLRHYDTQLLGGLILNENKIAEMGTGEGKTLVATAPAFLNALSGKGVHIVTINEYLAQRDAEWMGQIYQFLGLKVGLIRSRMESLQKRKNYNRDITYLTNSELGFDFLRDNIVTRIPDLVQRPLNYCILDEVDSILIDEARTPLIISRQSSVDIFKIIKATEVANFLYEPSDYNTDKKSRTISLTNLGIKKVETLLKVQNIYDSQEPWVPFILNALKAKTLFFNNIHYLVKNNKIVIVDEFTGRILQGRRWAEGLHNAIESKENIYNLEGSETIASITYQNLFRLYPKIAGMTGTAKTEELEFENIYNLSVSVLPTFKPIKRVDLSDHIYIDEITKWEAVTKECEIMYKLRRPVLVGTTTIQNSEFLSSLLVEAKIPHKLLNAKPENIKQESEIISQAGCLGSITIATNMAGRGTDVLLGGNFEFKAFQQTISILNAIISNTTIPQINEFNKLIFQIKKYKNRLFSLRYHLETFLNVINVPNKVLNQFENLIITLYRLIRTKYELESKKEKQKILELGGLYVIGTERHESRRIDNQLRGRAGRQGDVGTSRFFLSLNDPLLKIFGGEKIKTLMQVFQMSDETLESTFLSQSLDTAQKKIEGFYYSQRKNLNKYDKVLDKQRAIIYAFRKKILASSNIRCIILEFGETIINEIIFEKKNKFDKILISQNISDLFYELNFIIKSHLIVKDYKNWLYEQFWALYYLSELSIWFKKGRFYYYYEKLVVLRYIDIYWSKHIENMNFLRDSVVWEVYAQKDPFIQYEEQASILFTKIFKQCRNEIIDELTSIDFLS